MDDTNYFFIHLLAPYKFIYYLYDKNYGNPNISEDFNKHTDISGLWEGTINNNYFPPIAVKVEVKQTWSEIIIILSTDTAYSKTKCLSIDNEDKIRINYIYLDETRGMDNQELRNHEGTCSLLLSDDLKNMRGEYYTNHHRKTSGILELKKYVKRVKTMFSYIFCLKIVAFQLLGLEKVLIKKI